MTESTHHALPDPQQIFAPYRRKAEASRTPLVTLIYNPAGATLNAGTGAAAQTITLTAS